MNIAIPLSQPPLLTVKGNITLGQLQRALNELNFAFRRDDYEVYVQDGYSNGLRIINIPQAVNARGVYIDDDKKVIWITRLANRDATGQMVDWS